MPTRARIASLLFVLAALLLAPFLGSASGAYAQGGNLPVYTSPIDATGLTLQLQASVPDRDSGQPINIPVPPQVLPQNVAQLLSSPLSTQFDEFWNVKTDDTGKTRRQQACDAILQRLNTEVAKAGAGFSIYGYQCNLATRGTLLVSQDAPGILTFGYTLLDSSIELYVTTPVSCNRNNGTPVCPNDPGAKVSLVPQIIVQLFTPDVCGLRLGPPQAAVQSVDLETRGVINAAQFADSIFLGGYYRQMAEEAIRDQALKQIQGRLAGLSLDDGLAQLRNSATCSDRTSPGARILAVMSDLDTDIEPAQQLIILRLSHPPIAAPRFQNVDLPYGQDTCQQGFVWRNAFDGDTVCVTPDTRSQAAADNAAAASRREPNGGAYGPDTCRQGFVWRAARPEDHVCVTPDRRDQTANDNAQASQHRVVGDSTPSFLGPTITAPPVAAVGSTIKVSGQFFPQTADPTTIHLALERDTTSACLGGATELESGPASGSPHVDKLPSDGLSCTSRYEVQNLTAATGYRFRARDCDALTCSPWSAPVSLTTAAATGPGAVTLTIDGASLGTATVGADGTFDASVAIPAGTAAGNRTIRAVSGSANANTSLQVTAASGSSGGSRATLILTGSNFGDRGCPTRALPDYGQEITTGESFPAYGTGFAPGQVTLHLDSATGPSLGSATVGADGTFCSEAFQGPADSQVGNNHSLVAVQNNTAQATIPIRVVRPDVVR